MKNIITSMALLLCLALNAQTPEPKYTKDGDMVAATFYHENGAVAQTGHFLNGKLQGEWKMYDQDGKKIAAGQYENGQKVGKWFFWSGDDLKEVDFSNSQIVGVTTWNNAKTLVLNK